MVSLGQSGALCCLGGRAKLLHCLCMLQSGDSALEIAISMSQDAMTVSSTLVLLHKPIQVVPPLVPQHLLSVRADLSCVVD